MACRYRELAAITTHVELGPPKQARLTYRYASDVSLTPAQHLPAIARDTDAHINPVHGHTISNPPALTDSAACIHWIASPLLM